ncbi:hypothetical protein CRENBAI_011136 [Crenichthys baileyi]|uniref:Uncharacterized protein n=1 Tax=Crenichthys baileyi TaxID=28760 RepID=A0AAV9SE21_9TELE
MLPACLRSGFLRSTDSNRMIPPRMDLADEPQASSMDLFTFLSWEAEKTLRRLAGLSVPQSAYDGSRLAIPCPGTGPLRRRSPPAPLAAHQGLAAKPTSSFRHKKRRRGAPSCVSAGEESLTAAAVMPGAGTPLLAGRRAAASKPASLPATAPSPRLAAPPPMPSLLAPAWCSEATPDELEERLRFFARQIKTFRETSLMYSSPELMERIGQMERDYETAVRQFYCRPPSTPGLQGAAGAAEQFTPGLQGAGGAAEQSTPELQGAAGAAEQSTPGLQGTAAAAEQSTPGLQGAAGAAEQFTPGLQGAAGAAEQSTPGLQGAAGAAEQSTPGLQGAAGAAEQSTPGQQGAAGAAEQSTPGQQGAAGAAEQSTPGQQGAAAAAEQSTPGQQGAAAAAEQSTPGQQGAAAAAEQSTPGLQPAVELSESPEGGLPPLPGPEHLLSFLWWVLMELKTDTHHDTPQPVSARSDTPQPDTPQPVSARPDTPQPVSARPDTPQPVSARPDTPQPVSARPDTPQPVSARPDTPQPDTKSASTSSTRRRGRRKRDTSVHATEGLGDASAFAHPLDEGFEEEAPPDPVSGDFKGQFVLVLASEPRDEGSPGNASASEGSPGAASASEGSPGAASASEGSPDATSASEGSPGAASASEGSPGSASEGSPGIRGRPPELCACSGRPPGRPPELCPCWGRPPGRPPELCPCFWPSCHGPPPPARVRFVFCLDSCGRLVSALKGGVLL